MEALGASLQLPLIDLVPDLKAADQLFRPAYFAFDGHWNARGHDVAAAAIHDWMKRSSSLPATCGGGRLKEHASTAAVWEPAPDPGHPPPRDDLPR
jgi:hypothetical protein